MAKRKAKDTSCDAVFDRKTDGYDPGMDPLGLSFGLPFPNNAERAHGFRAIKHAKGFDLLHDRQSDWPQIGRTDEWTKEHLAFLQYLDDHVLPVLQKHSTELDGSDPRYLQFVFTYQGKIGAAIISPRASYGYVYGVAYVLPAHAE